MIKDAVISDSGFYRYELSRIWDHSKPLVMFVMLNPSTADSNEDDPTIRRCIGFAKSWGYGGLYVGNLFGYRSTDPKKLLLVSHPIGSENKYHLKLMADRCETIICAWGNPVIVKKTNRSWRDLLFLNKELRYIKKCKDGTPSHPLFLKGDLKTKLLINGK